MALFRRNARGSRGVNVAVDNAGHRFLLALLAAVPLAVAGAPAHAVFVVNAPWLKPAAAGGSADLYMTLTSTEGATLVAVRCESADEARILAPGAPPRAVAQLALPAGRHVGLAAGGSRIRLTGLARALALGDRLPFVLTIEDADGRRQDVAVDAEVRRHSPLYDHLHGHAH